MFEILDFDMILGIYFLRRNRVKIDYHYKKVWFRLENGDQFEFDERNIKSLMISALKARKMLSEKCTGFLAHVISKVESRLSIKEIPVVREFPNVFESRLSIKEIPVVQEFPNVFSKRVVGISS